MLSCSAGPSAIGAAIASTDSTAATKLGGSVSVPRMSTDSVTGLPKVSAATLSTSRCSTSALAPNAADAAADGDSFAPSRTLAVETTRGPGQHARDRQRVLPPQRLELLPDVRHRVVDRRGKRREDARAGADEARSTRARSRAPGSPRAARRRPPA